MLFSGLIAQIISQTFVLGSLYGLVGVGFVVLFRSTGVVNFAQGAFMVVGAYSFYQLYVRQHQPFIVALVAAIIVVAILGALVNLLMFRRLIGADLFIVVVATMGLSLTLQTIVLIAYGPDVYILPTILSSKTLIQPLGVPFTPLDLFAIGSALALIIVLELLLRRSLLGVRMRAVADSSLLSALQRVRVPAYSGLAWAISGLCSGLAGVTLAMGTAVDSSNISALGLLIFPVVIIGGVDSIRGALVGGLIVAAIQETAGIYLGGNWVDPCAYGLLLIVLLFRPRGLFGTREIVRI